MSERVELYVLAVGQGSCNLVAFYDENEQMVQLDLIDCGRRGGKILSEVLQNQMDFIRQQMQNRALALPEDSVAYYLDHLIISHADADHINLLTSKYFLNGLTPENQKKDFASFLFQDERYGVLVGKEGVLEWRKPFQNTSYYTYRIDLSFEWNGSEQVIDAELILEWSYNQEKNQEKIVIDRSKICYDFFDQKQCASVYVLFKWNTNQELYLCSINCEIEYEDQIIQFESYFIQKKNEYHTKITQTLKNGVSKWMNDNKDDMEEMLQFMADVLELEEGNTILVFIEEAIVNVVSIGDIHNVLDVDYAKSILNPDEGEKGNCIIKEVIMGGLSNGIEENKKTVNTILNKLGGYNSDGVMYMETTGNIQVGVASYLQKLPRYGTYEYRQNREFFLVPLCDISDENSGSITYSAKVFDQWIVLPGDATGDTMWYFVNELWDDQNMPKGAYMTAPHHGSNVTTITKVFGDEDDLLEGYLRTVEPNEIIISAGYENNFGHPHCGFLQVAQHLVRDTGEMQPAFPCSLYVEGKKGIKKRWVSWIETQNIHSCLVINGGQCEYRNRKIEFKQESEPISCEEECIQFFNTLPQPQMQIQANRQANRRLTLGEGNREFDFLIGESIE